MVQQAGTPIPEPVAIVDSSGKFSDTWRDSLPEDIRGDESLKVVTDFPGLVRQHINAQKMVGKDKVVLPGPNATDAEKDAFFTAIGRPKTAGDYTVVVPGELKDIFEPTRLEKARQVAHKLGITQAQFEGYMAAEIEAAKEMLGGQDEADQLARQTADKDLRTRFGGAYDERMHVANRLVEEICRGDADESRKIALLQKFGNDPDFIEFTSDCGAKLVEHKGLIADLTQQTPKEKESRMAELRATPGFIIPDKDGKYLNDTDPQKKKAIMAEINRLTVEAYPDARPARLGR
jgi:hypothetical protein